jgi:hypothetical protein
LQEQFDLAMKIRDKTSEANQAVIRIREPEEANKRSIGESRKTRRLPSQVAI